MGDPQTVTMIDPQGNARAVPADAIPAAVAAGFKVENSQQHAERLVDAAREEAYGGVLGKVGAFAAGVNRAVTFGGSDVVGGAIGGDQQRADYQGLREVNPGLSTAGEIGGALLTAVPSGGESLAAQGLGKLAAATPGGMVARLGGRIAEAGGESLLGRTAATALSGAVEGAAQSAGAYVSDVALGDRDLSADGFIGAMGHGALWGGAAGGALELGGEALQVTRRLFPKQEMTSAAVEKASQAARTAVKETIEDADALVAGARTKLADKRRALSTDPVARQQLDEVAAKNAREFAEFDPSPPRPTAETPRPVRKAMTAEAGPSGETRVSQTSSAEPTDTATLLERQLAGTRAGLDQGETLGTLAQKRPAAIGLKPTHVEDALNAHIAKVDPEAEKMVRAISDIEDAKVGLGGWLDKYSKKPTSLEELLAGTKAGLDAGETIGSVAQKGKALRVTGEDVVNGHVRSVKDIEADIEAHGARAKAALKAGDRDVAGQAALARQQAQAELAQAKKAGGGLDDHVRKALGSRVKAKDFGFDVTDTASAVGKLERAHADLADALGTSAPMRAQEQAAAYRQAERASTQGTANATAQATGDAEKAAATVGLHGELPAAGKKPGKHGVLEKLLHTGDIIEALHMMGVPVPDPKQIPIIGPVLKAVLQARVLGKAFGRFGGKVAASAETTIASKAAATRQRVYGAVDAMLEGAAAGSKMVAPKVGAVAEVLGHKLFDDGTVREEPAKGDIREIFTARADELQRATAPGAIETAVKDKVRASDPAAVQAIIDGLKRKLSYLYDKSPKPDMPPGMLAPKEDWSPGLAEMRAFARVVAAADDPAGVLERAAAGGVVLHSEIDAVKNIYPSLYEDARQRLVTQAIEKGSTVPIARRVQMSLLFDLPLDATMRPDYVHFLQQGSKAAAMPAAPQAPMPHPTISADVRVGQRMDPLG